MYMHIKLTFTFLLQTGNRFGLPPGIKPIASSNSWSGKTNKKRQRKHVIQQPDTAKAAVLPVDDFRVAVRNGNVDAVRKYLEQGIIL